MFDENDIVQSHKKRNDVLAIFIIASFAILLARLWFLQIYMGDTLLRYSLNNRLRKENIPAPRGMIYEQNNILLVHNISRFDVIITPQYLRNKELTIMKLAKILDIKPEVINKKLHNKTNQAEYIPITIKKNLTRKEVAIIETENAKMPGVSIKEFISREYKDKEIGVHLLGYIAEISQNQLQKLRKRDNVNYKLGDFIGKSGIEERLDLNLRGNDGYRFMEVDAHGRMKGHIEGRLFADIQNKAMEPGHNIRLTIDRDLQLAAHKALEKHAGSVVAVDIHTGEVLAMISRPSFNPTQREMTTDYWNSLINNDKRPFRNRVIQEHYPPGSTFKVITAIAALEEGIINTKTTVNCEGAFRSGRRKFHCWKKSGHGKVNLTKSLRESCDVYYYKIATMLDIDILAKYARLFGFGAISGIDLAGETPGLIPTREWKRQRNGEPWIKGETLSCAIGQSFVLATPLQLAMSYAAIANNGKLYRPKIVKEIFLNSGETLQKERPTLIREIEIKPNTFEAVRKALWEAVNSPEGTAWWQRGRGIDMAGKTGTSQVISLLPNQLFSKCEDRQYKYRHHGLFAAFVPYEEPKIAISAVVEHGCHGSSAAAPIVRDIAQTYMKKYFPKKYKSYLTRDKKIHSQSLNKLKTHTNISPDYDSI